MRQPPEGTSPRTPPGSSSAAGRSAPLSARQAGEAQPNAEMPPASTSRNALRPYGRTSVSGAGNDLSGVGRGRHPEARPVLVCRQVEVRPAGAGAVDHEPTDRRCTSALFGVRPEQELVSLAARHTAGDEGNLDVRLV